jgi:hypothetical protein
VPLRQSVPLRRALPPKRRTPVREKRSGARRGPERNPEYLARIRSLGCVVCARVSGSANVIEAAHTNVLGPGDWGRRRWTSRRFRSALGIAVTIRIRTTFRVSEGFRTAMGLT